MARALIVGCGGRGRALGRALLEDGWVVRGTTRSAGRLDAIECDGLQAVVADPVKPGTVLDEVGDVAVVFWLLGNATGEPDDVAAIHGSRLEGLLERLVDTPVRGFVYEGAGAVAQELLRGGAASVSKAGATWRIPVRVIEARPDEADVWLTAMRDAAASLVG